MWDFETEPEFEEQLVWAREFVRDEVTPLELLDVEQPVMDRIMAPMKEEVKRRGMWAAHLEPELGGGGWGQVRLGLLHEILGRTYYGPQVFGNNAPDSGNAELIALGSTERGAEGAVALPAAGGEAPQRVLDDGARCRCRPHAHRDAGRP